MECVTNCFNVNNNVDKNYDRLSTLFPSSVASFILHFAQDIIETYVL